MQTNPDFYQYLAISHIFPEHALDTLQSCLFLHVQRSSAALAPVFIYYQVNFQIYKPGKQNTSTETDMVWYILSESSASVIIKLFEACQAPN